MDGLQYFGTKKWAEITREERYFCSHLYHSIIGKEKEFVKWLNENIKPEGKLKLDEDNNWEVSFEVCFYRDFLKSQNQSVKTYKRKNGEFYSQKRTFDLCLFSADEMIIIEANAQQGFTGKQLNEILKDKEDVEELTKEFSMNKKARIILLHSSRYSPTDSRVKNFSRFTWKDLAEYDSSNTSLYNRADSLYNDRTSL